MNSKLLLYARLLLSVNLLVYLGFFIAFTFWPTYLAKLLLGVTLDNPVALCDIRGMYAGLSGGAALFILRSILKPRWTVAGLNLTVYLAAGLALERLMTFALQGDTVMFNVFVTLSLVSEIGAAMAGVVLLRFLREEN